MSNATKQIQNSFTLKFINTTNTRRKVQLFEQGSDSTLSVSKVESSVANGFQGTLTLPPTLWNFGSTQPFGYPNPTSTSNLEANWDVNDFRLRANFSGIIQYNFGSTKFSLASAGGLLQNMTIGEVNDRINYAIRNFSSELKSPSGLFVEIYVYIDQDYINSQTFPLNLTFPTTYKAWGISVQYPHDFPPSQKIEEVQLQSNFLNAGEWQDIDTIPTTTTSSANGIEVDDSASTISYDEIEKSQVGAVYDIASMSLNIGKTPSQDYADGQMLQPLCYDKRDVNGNSITFCKVPTKDPYQFQDSYSVLEMSTDDDDFILDGNTQFAYELEPQTTAILTFNYSKLNNLVADTELGVKAMEKEKEELKISDTNRSQKNTITITALLDKSKKKNTNKRKKAKSTKNFSNFISYSDEKQKHKARKYTAYVMGIGVGLLLFNKFKNQTK